jgi:hypothetical protein
VAYTFTENWEAETIAPYIGAIDGFIQCDDYKGYSKTVTSSMSSDSPTGNAHRRIR